MSTRTVFSYVGAVIGAYFGAPQVGWAIGSYIGGAVDPEIIKGPSVGDIANQTSQEGGPRPIVFALSQPMAGNIIASGEPEIVRRRQSQGKGGPKVETESVYRTYAIGVCEGPITRFVRVWRNNALVYDVSENPLLTIGDNNKFLQHARFFLGSYLQDPSPDLEAEFGVGTTPAHRGTAYLVMADEDLTDLRGAIPQYMFQVERCDGVFLTSRPYPIEDTAALDSDALVVGGYQVSPGREGLDSTFEVVGGSLYGGVVTYEDGDPEGLDASFEVVGGSMFGGLVSYEEYPPEALDASFEVIGGSLFGDLVTYEEYPPEGLDAELEVLGGTLGA